MMKRVYSSLSATKLHRGLRAWNTSLMLIKHTHKQLIARLHGPSPANGHTFTALSKALKPSTPRYVTSFGNSSRLLSWVERSLSENISYSPSLPSSAASPSPTPPKQHRVPMQCRKMLLGLWRAPSAPVSQWSSMTILVIAN